MVISASSDSLFPWEAQESQYCQLLLGPSYRQVPGKTVRRFNRKDEESSVLRRNRGKQLAVLGEIVRTFGGCCAERVEAGELTGLTFALRDREGFQEEVAGKDVWSVWSSLHLSHHFPCAFYLNQSRLSHWRWLLQGGFWGPW